MRCRCAVHAPCPPADRLNHRPRSHALALACRRRPQRAGVGRGGGQRGGGGGQRGGGRRGGGGRGETPALPLFPSLLRLPRLRVCLPASPLTGPPHLHRRLLAILPRRTSPRTRARRHPPSACPQQQTPRSSPQSASSRDRCGSGAAAAAAAGRRQPAPGPGAAAGSIELARLVLRTLQATRAMGKACLLPWAGAVVGARPRQRRRRRRRPCAACMLCLCSFWRPSRLPPDSSAGWQALCKHACILQRESQPARRAAARGQRGLACDKGALGVFAARPGGPGCQTRVACVHAGAACSSS